MTLSKWQLAHAARARAIVKDLLDSLGATTSYAERTSRRREKLPWRAFYGWQLALTAANGAIIKPDGDPTQWSVLRKFSHDPGDIITGAARRTCGPLTRYMVRADRSLGAI